MILKRVALFCSTLSILTLAVTAQPTSSATGSSSSASTTSNKAVRFTPTKDQIMRGQKFLKEQKLYTGEATGIYNDATRAALRAYQKDNGLTVTGNFNQATVEKMGIALTDKQKGIAPAATNGKTGVVSPTDSSASKTAAVTPTDSSAAKRPAPFRANADQIRAAQKILRDSKMLIGGDDGKLDDATREGLKKYQEANGLKVMGSLNAATLEKMKIPLTDTQKVNVAAQAAYDAARAQRKPDN